MLPFEKKLYFLLFYQKFYLLHDQLIMVLTILQHFAVKTYYRAIFFFLYRLGETKQYTKGLDNQTTFDEPVPKNIPRKR